MASFGVSMVDVGSMAAAAGAGLLNATAAAAPPAAAHAVQLAARVSPGAVTAVQVLGNFFSVVALLIPMHTSVLQVHGARGVGSRKINSFIYVFFTALFWLLFAIPSRPRTWLTLTVNCVGIASQSFYIVIYLKHAVRDNFNHSRFMVMISAVFAVGIFVMAAPLLLMNDPWRVEVLGIVASTFATAVSRLGMFDVVTIIREQRSGLNMCQLIANLISAIIWAVYGFLFTPVNKYVIIPNLTTVGVTIIQMISHGVLGCKDKRRSASAMKR